MVQYSMQSPVAVEAYSIERQVYNMINEMKIQEFLQELSSKQPVPGGGGASALGGALGTALGLMVGNLTVGKKKYAHVEADVLQGMEQLERLQSHFVTLADEDAQVFAPLAQAYRLPSETEKEKEYKDRIMEERLLSACLVPLRIMEDAVEALKVLGELEQKGSIIAISDVGVAVQFIRTALSGAVMNVYINTKSMKDEKKSKMLNQQAEKLLESGLVLADQIYGRVLNQLKR